MNKKVLVVDDNANNLMLEKDLLEVGDLRSFTAENAADGLLFQERNTGHHNYGCAASGYVRYRGRNDITSRQRDPGYPVFFVTAFVMGRR